VKPAREISLDMSTILHVPKCQPNARKILKDVLMENVFTLMFVLMYHVPQDISATMEFVLQ